MTIGRVTFSGMAAAAERNMQSAQQRFAAAQDKASSLKSINRPSDNPSDTASAMAVRGQQKAQAQYARNASDAQGWLSMADNALSTSTDLLQRARQLVLAGSNQGTMSQESRESLALEIDALREGLLNSANTTYMGRHIFAGTSDATAAFSAGEYLHPFHDGSQGGPVERKVGQHTKVRVDADGMAAFGSGEDSVFALFEQIAADLRSGAPLNEHLNALEQRHSAVLQVHTTIGAAHSSVLRAEDSLRTESVALETRRAALEDVDLAEVSIELQSTQLAYQASLMVTSRVLQTTLMDYLR